MEVFDGVVYINPKVNFHHESNFIGDPQSDRNTGGSVFKADL